MDNMDNKIDLTNLPEEPFVDVLDPEDNVIWSGNNPLHLDYIRLQIKNNKLTGYKIRAKSGNIYKINEYGKYAEPMELSEIPGDLGVKQAIELI